jgi:hypothetical protein
MTAYSLDHIAIAVPSWSLAGPVLSGVLGGRWRHGFRLPHMNVCQLSYANDMRVELLEPGAAPDSFVQRFLTQSGDMSRPHHLTFKVADIEHSIATASRCGIEPILVNLSHDSWREMFLHPRATGLGSLIQLVQSSVEPADSHPEGLLPAPWTEPVGMPPAAISFVVVHVAAPDRPRRVLAEILGGREEKLDAPQGWQIRRFSWSAGADVVLASSAELPGRPGIQAIGIEPGVPLDLPTTPVFEGFARTVPILELGVPLLVRAPKSAG